MTWGLGINNAKTVFSEKENEIGTHKYRTEKSKKGQDISIIAECRF